MKRKLPGRKNPIAKVLLRSNEINARKKVEPNKKGRGSVYTRKGRGKGFDPSFISSLRIAA